MTDPERVKMERFGDSQDHKPRTKERAEPKWKLLIAPTLPESPCHIGDVEDPCCISTSSTSEALAKKLLVVSSLELVALLAFS
jgi:hypothetical protein